MEEKEFWERINKMENTVVSTLVKHKSLSIIKVDENFVKIAHRVSLVPFFGQYGIYMNYHRLLKDGRIINGENTRADSATFAIIRAAVPDEVIAVRRGLRSGLKLKINTWEQLIHLLSVPLLISEKQLENDIKDMVDYWECCLERGHILDGKLALLFLNNGIHCYLRAKQIYIGDFRGWENETIVERFLTSIQIYLLQQTERDTPKILELLPSVSSQMTKSFTTWDIPSQVNEILS